MTPNQIAGAIGAVSSAVAVYARFGGGSFSLPPLKQQNQ